MQAERWERAEREFASAVRLDPLMMLAHYGRGQALMALRLPRAALSAFLECRAVYHTITAMIRSRNLAAERRIKEEIGEVRDTIRLLEGGQLRVSSSQQQVLRLEQRLRALERTTIPRESGESVPPELSLALGSAYFRLDRLDEAEREYRLALKTAPDFGEAHNNLAVVCMMTGRLEEARREVALAEAAGYRVNPRFREDLDALDRR